MSTSEQILAGAAALCAGALAVAGLCAASGRAAQGGYEVSARFDRSDGIVVGSEVRLAGLRVGEVVGHSLDGRYRAVVAMRLRDGLGLSADTAAVIETDGLLGAKYVTLRPGGDEALLPPGGVIGVTQGSVLLEDLLEAIIAEAKARRGSFADGNGR